MAYLKIGTTEYLVREGEGRGRWLQIENRRRAIDGSLLVDGVADKREVQVDFAGLASSSTFLTPAEANSLMTTLRAGAVSVSGDLGAFTARARDVGWVDAQHYPGGSAVLYRTVSATLEEV